jgi:hypothetical protein
MILNQLPGYGCVIRSDETINVIQARCPIATMTHEVGHNPNQESRYGTYLLGL